MVLSGDVSEVTVHNCLLCPRGQFWNGQNIGERKVKEENKLKGAWEKRSLTFSYWNNLGKKKSESV